LRARERDNPEKKSIPKIYFRYRKLEKSLLTSSVAPNPHNNIKTVPRIRIITIIIHVNLFTHTNTHGFVCEWSAHTLSNRHTYTDRRPVETERSLRSHINVAYVPS